jgi:hypothetical protein
MPEDARNGPAHKLISKQIIGYGSIGVLSAIIIQFTSGFGGDHLLLLLLGMLFWIAFSSSIAWVLWKFVIPMTGREGSYNSKK